MKHLYTFLVLLLALFLVGCGTPPNVKTDYVFHAVPDALLLPGEGIPPPNKDDYLQATWDQREKMWVDIYRKQDVQRKILNNQFKQIQVWNKDQQTLYDQSREAK